MFFSILGFIIVILFGFFIYLYLIREAEIIEAIVSSIGLGFGTLGVLLFVENIYFKISFGFSNALILLIVFLIFDLLLYVKVKNALLEFKNRLFYKIKFFNFSKAEIILLVPTILVTAIIFYKLVLLPINMQDALNSWACFPKNIFNQKNISLEIGSFLTNKNAFPNLLSIQASWFYFLNGKINDIWVRFLSFVYFISTILMAYRLGYEYLKKRTWALLALYLLFANTIFVISAIHMNNQQAVWFYSVAFFYFFEKFFKTKNIKFLFVSGICGGLAGFVKYTAAPFVLALCSLFVIFIFLNSRLRLNEKYFTNEISKKKILIVFLAPIVILTSLWVVRNLYYFHDPVYPYISGAKLSIIPSEDSKNSPSLSKKFKKQYHIIRSFNFFFMFLFIYSFVNNYKKNILRPEFYCVFMTYILFLPIILSKHTVSACARYLTVFLPLTGMIVASKIYRIFNEPDRRHEVYLLSGLLLFVLIYLATTFSGQETGLVIPPLERITSFISLAILFIYSVQGNRLKQLPVTKKSYQLLCFAIIFCLLITPSFIRALHKNFDQTKDTFPYIKLYFPSKHEVINSGQQGTYEFHSWANDRLNKSKKILGFIRQIYYFENEFIAPNDARLQTIYTTSSLSEAISVLSELDIAYIIDATNTPVDILFEHYFHNTVISKNLANKNFFHLLYDQNNFRLYEIRSL